MTPEERRERARKRTHSRKRAQARLDAELASAPAWGTPELHGRLQAHRAPDAFSHGLVVHFIRYARKYGYPPAQRPVAYSADGYWQTLYMTLRGRIRWMNRRWVNAVLAQEYRLLKRDPTNARRDLRHSLDEILLAEIGDETKFGWELYFRRSLGFAHLKATRQYLKSHGYDVRAGHPRHLAEWLAHEIAATSPGGADPQDDDEKDDLYVAADNPLMGDDYLDMIQLASLLPYKWRATLFMRFIDHASKTEIAETLKVDKRTVTTYQQRGLSRLKALYLRDQNQQQDT